MDARKKNKILVQVTCVLASFVLWIYISITGNPAGDRTLPDVPVTIVGLDKLANNLVLDQDKPYTVDLKLKGPTMDLNNVKVSQFKLEADVSGYVYKAGEEYNVIVKVKEQPLLGVVYIQDANLSIKIKFDELIEKNIPVRSEFKITPKSGFAMLSDVVKPTSAAISGPSKYVNSVEYARVTYEAKDADKDIMANRPLQPVDKAGNVVNQVSVTPQTADIYVPIRKTKTVGININTKGNMGKDLILKAKEAVPDKVDIASDQNLLDGINTLDTEPIDLSTVTGNTTIEVKLVVPNNITLVNSKGVVNVKLTVEKQAQKNFSLDIGFNNLGADYTMTADKAKASLVITGPESKLNALTAEDIKCYVDLANLGEGEDHTLPLVINVPEGLAVASATPQSVRVVISKKAPANAGGTVGTGTSGTGTGTGTGTGNDRGGTVPDTGVPPADTSQGTNTQTKP